MTQIHGIDISHWQGNVDFHALKDNADFVIIKATQGTNYTDSAFYRNRDGARKVGLALGYYHYATPQYNSPIAEADWFCRVVSCEPGEIICLDFEEHYPDPVGWCKVFLDRCTSNMGFKPLVYLNYALIKGYDWKPVVDKGYGLWLAYWDYNPDAQLPPTDWSLVAMRQYSNKGNVAGINPVDLNVFYGDVTAFKKYGNPPPAPPEPQPLPEPQEPEPEPNPPTPPIVSIPDTSEPKSFFSEFINWLLGLFGKHGNKG